MIPTNIRRADELKWRDDVLKRVSQNQCRCQQQPQSQKMPQSALSTNNPSPPPAYTASVPRNQKQVYNPPNNTSQKFGNCLAVRKGPFISISGLTPSPSSSNNAAQQQQQQQLHLSNASAQAMQAMRQGIQSVKELGGKGAEDVIRVKISIADPKHIDEVGLAFWSLFANDEATGIGATMSIAVVAQEGFRTKYGDNINVLVEIDMDAVVD